MTEFEAKKVLSLYNIPVNQEMMVDSVEEAVAAFNALQKPVAMKIVSPDIIHKTEANCVKLNLRDEEEIRKSYQEILDNAKSYCESPSIKGFLIQEMIQEGTEVIVGTSYDETFGPVLMFGLGGIFVEIGLIPNSDFAKGSVNLNKYGEIIVDCFSRTSVPGIFAASHVTTVPSKQIVVAAGEGAKAALSAYDYLIMNGFWTGRAMSRNQ